MKAAMKCGNVHLMWFILIGSNMGGNPCIAADTQQLLSTARYSDSNISLVATTRGPTEENFLTVRRSDGRQLDLSLESGVGLAKNIVKVYGGLFVIDFSSGAPYSMEVIFDSQSMTVRDKITCYDPVLSPNGRVLAFKKFFPAGGLENESMGSNFEMVYDFSKSEMQNYDPRRREAKDEEDSVGILVYPRSWVLQSDRNHPSALITYLFSGSPVWSADSSKFIFLEKHYDVDQDDQDGTEPGQGSNVGLRWMPFGLVLVDLTSARAEVRERVFGDCFIVGGCNAYMLGAEFGSKGVELTVGDFPGNQGTQKLYLGFADFNSIE